MADWMKDVQAAFVQVEALAREWTWRRQDLVGDKDVKATVYVAKEDDWNVVVTAFSIEDQGFPPGTLGYDGMIRHGATIIHMTREVAESVFRKAEAASSNHPPGVGR